LKPTDSSLANRLSRVLIGLGVVVGLAAFSWLVSVVILPKRLDPKNPPIHEFPGVSGPIAPTVVPAVVPADWRQYDTGEPSRLAILLTDENSDWLGLAHGLKTIGVPFRITRDATVAARHRVVLVYPTISGRALTADALRLLAGLPARGGTLIGFGVEGGGLDEVFGFSGTAVARTHRTIRFAGGAAVTAEFTDVAEQELPVNSPAEESAVAQLSYVPTSGEPLARYGDGRVAILRRQVGTGAAYAFGFDAGFLLLKGYNDRQDGLARSYANGFEPLLDVVLRLLRNLYTAGEPAAVTLHTVPDNRPLTVLLTHDVDYSRSLANTAAYAALEQGAGVPATYFIQCKYVRDWNDDVFLDDQAGPALRQLAAAGMEIASHSVAHSRSFNQFPPGTGRERYPDYRPFVLKQSETVNGTILGELRVSKFLLEHFTPGLEVRSFRPGHLRNPFALPQSLEAGGYRYSSATTANNALTHLPFRLTHGRGKTAATGIYEFPVTIEDEAPPQLDQRLPGALAVAERLSRYGGLFNVLIHTDVTGFKLEFERGLIAALKDRAWFDTVRGFGAWWAARDRVELDVSCAADHLTIQLRAPEPVEKLTLDVPAGWRYTGAVPARQTGRRLVLDRVEGEQRLEFAR
jgi:peptidoglycan/xylan/chitin deacetylase (PgdA/CDA1 family)